jgi:hypothetical protein
MYEPKKGQLFPMKLIRPQIKRIVIKNTRISMQLIRPQTQKESYWSNESYTSSTKP